MAASVVLLVIFSAVAHAAWNAILKRCRDPENAIVGVTGVATVAAALYAVARRVSLPSLECLEWSLLAGVLEAGYFVTLARALARAPLGSVYTVVRGGALVFVWPISVLLLGERLTPFRIAGTVFVVLGLVATGAGDRGAKPIERTGLAGAVLCALFVSGYHLAYKLALSTPGTAEAVVAISMATAFVLNVSVLGSRRRLALKVFLAEPKRIVTAGLLAGTSFLVFLMAMRSEGAGAILTLRNASILFAQLFALALGERPRALGLIGAGLVTAGAVLLAR